MRTRRETLLSTLWIFVILNIFARDIHELGRPGMLEQMMTGVIDGVTITPGLMLIGGIMIEIFLVMVVLSQVLKPRINRMTNLIVGVLAIVITIGVNQNPDLDNLFFAAIELIALVAIIRVAWGWRLEASQESVAAGEL